MPGPTPPSCQRRRTGTGPTRFPVCSPRGPFAASGRGDGPSAPRALVAGNDEGRTGRPCACPAAAGPSARAAVPSFCEGDAGRTRACSRRGASGEDAALASAFGLPCDKLTALSRAEGRLTQAVEESACRTGGPERHDRVLFLSCLAEPQRARAPKAKAASSPLACRTPCARARSCPPQNAEGGQDDACRRPPPHGAAASRDSGHLGHPPVIAGRWRVRGNRAAHSPHGRRRLGVRGSRLHDRWMDERDRVAAQWRLCGEDSSSARLFSANPPIALRSRAAASLCAAAMLHRSTRNSRQKGSRLPRAQTPRVRVVLSDAALLDPSDPDAYPALQHGDRRCGPSADDEIASLASPR